MNLKLNKKVGIDVLVLICDGENYVFKGDLVIVFVVFEEGVNVVGVECFEDGGVVFGDIVNVNEGDICEL